MSSDQLYSVRNGVAPNRGKPGLAWLRSQFAGAYNEIVHMGLLDEVFGVDCDEDYSLKFVGRWGANPSHMFENLLGKTGLLPVRTQVVGYSEADVFDVVEVVCQASSRPLDSQWCHRCEQEHLVRERRGWDHRIVQPNEVIGDPVAGKAMAREIFNKFLRKYGDGFVLDDLGHVQRLAPAGIAELIDREVDTNSPLQIDERIRQAVARYYHHNSDIQQRKAAIVEAGSVLEFLKKRFGRDGVPVVEPAATAVKSIFNVLNGYGFRHNDLSQNTDYDPEVYYDWIFNSTLVTVHGFLRLGAHVLAPAKEATASEGAETD